MYTQCPECKTIFGIDEDALQASLGIVRCGHCQARFDALLTLSNSLPTEPDAGLPAQDPETLTPTLTEAISADAIKAAANPRRKRKSAAEPPPDPVSEPVADWLTPAAERTRELLADAAGIPHEAIEDEPEWPVIELPLAPTAATADPPRGIEPAAATTEPAPPASEPAPDRAGVITLVETATPDTAPAPAAEPAPPTPTDAAEPPAPDAASDATHTDDAPVYVPPRPRRRHRHDWLWASGCALLLLALAAQLGWANRAALMQDPATQPWLLDACARVACAMPPIRDVAELELLSRDIRPDPQTAGALVITATVRNNAQFAQPWPIVVVRLTDLDNAPVAMRRFRPAEYLPDAARRAAGLAPGATAALAFEVADPGQRAVAFHFGFD